MPIFQNVLNWKTVKKKKDRSPTSQAHLPLPHGPAKHPRLDPLYKLTLSQISVFFSIQPWLNFPESKARGKSLCVVFY